MYHPDVIADRQDRILAVPEWRQKYGHVDAYTADDDTTKAFTAQILGSRDPETGKPIRALTRDEQLFIKAAQFRVTYDGGFYLRNFVYIDQEGHGIRALYPLWPSQQFVLDRLAAVDYKNYFTDAVDGILLNILKVRQVGISTLGMALVSHRLLAKPFVRSICGSDTEEQARYLFRMVERIYDQLPYFLRPERAVPYSTGRELNLATKSSIKSAWGKTTRGALQAEGGKKGNIERGRSQPLDEPVLTPTGWRRMGDLLAGDTVIGSQGVPTPIIGIYPQGVEAVYRVHFSDDAWTECSGDHLWQVTTAARRWKGQAPFVRTTQDLLDGGLYWNKPSGRMAKWFIPTVQPVEFPARLHTIPPYTLGVYLGDGSTRVGALQIAARDPEIEARVASELPPELYVGTKKYDHCWYIRRHGNRRSHLYLAELERLNLRNLYSHEKFIPTDYHVAPVADRVALLQGILDTDGWAQQEDGRVCFCTTSLRLAVGVKSLVESLGGVARMTNQPPKKSHVRKNGQRITGRFPSFRLSICLPAGIVPFSVPRKVQALRPEQQRKYFPSRAIVGIEYVGQKETQCIRVAAADQLYVTRQFVVTHNTNSVVHISELATWDNPEQLDSSLLPGIPIHSDTLVMFESTAELAGDWWHRHWLATQEGNGRFQNLFLAWPVKYQLPAPEGWVPNSATLSVARQIEQESPQWVGEALKLTRDHLYWYEQTRAYYASKNQLLQFFKEYPSNPEECFQYAGQSVFSIEECARIDSGAKPLLDVWTVQSSREIAELRRLPPEDQKDQQKADQRRYKPPLAAKQPRLILDVNPAPEGYGFRRLTHTEVKELPSLRHTVMAVYEYPRRKPNTSYVIGVDVGDGLGQDYSVITVVRSPTIEEPSEDVAQFVSNTIRPSELAFVADAIGHFYCDLDGYEACMAVELNNHGITVQDLLQLHLGYTNFYVWEVVDAAQADARFTKRIGWTTTTRTRPILLEKFHDAVTTIDPLSDPAHPIADLRLNSPITRAELRHFVTEGLLGEAEHAKGQHDDAIFSTAIGYYVAYRLSGGESEPLAERRRRRAAARAVQTETGVKRDWRNTTTSAISAQQQEDDDDDDALHADADGSYFDPRTYAGD